MTPKTPREALRNLEAEDGFVKVTVTQDSFGGVNIEHRVDYTAILTALAPYLRTPGTVEVCSLCRIMPINNCGGVDDGGIKSPCPLKQVTNEKS